MRIAGAWAWRILAIIAAVAVVCWGLAQVSLLVIPVLIAALITSLTAPLVTFLTRHKWPRGLAVAVVMLLLLFTVTGLVWLAVTQLRAGYPQLQTQAFEFYESAKEWLLNSPLQISQEDINNFGQDVVESIRNDARTWFASALSWGTTAGHVVAGSLLALFSTLFLLLDGRKIWEWITRLLPRNARPAVDSSARAGWTTLGTFMRVQVLVAAIDAVGIGIGAAILGLPLVIPISILVFLASFIPFVGAIATGFLAVFVALVTLGPVKALIMLGIVLLVQQIESHVLQPLIMGNAVEVHPLGVVLAVTGGSIIAGIPGALFAVPLTAFVNVFVSSIASGKWRQGPEAAAAAAEQSMDDQPDPPPPADDGA